MEIKINIPKIEIEIPDKYLDKVISHINKQLFPFQKNGVYVDRMQIFYYEGFKRYLTPFKDLIRNSLGEKIDIDELINIDGYTKRDRGIMLQFNFNPAVSINLIQKFLKENKVYNTQDIIRSLDLRVDSLFYGEDLTTFIKDKDSHLYKVMYVPGSMAYFTGDSKTLPQILERVK